MAQFNIDAHIGNGKRLEWLALADGKESADDVLGQVRRAAVKKFGTAVQRNRWERIASSNGFVTVRMHA